MNNLIKSLILSSALVGPIFAKTVMCPEQISCNYNEGICTSFKGEDISETWFITSSNNEKTPKNSVYNLKKILGDQFYKNKVFQRDAKYLTCSYSTVDSENITATIEISREIKEFKGVDWERYGFGKRYIKCLGKDIYQCFGEV